MFFERYHLKLRQEALGLALINKEIDHAQRIIEGQNFDIRKSLWKYSSLVELQRQTIHAWRESIFFSRDPSPILSQQNAELYEKGLARFGQPQLDSLERRVALFNIDRFWSDHLAWVNDTRESIHLVSLGGMTPIHEFMKSVTAVFMEIRGKVEDAVVAALRPLIKKEGPLDLDAEGIKGPSSTWTYLINEDQFGWGIEMMKGRNIGFSVGAAAFYGPLFIFALFVNRLFGRKNKK
jgi:preprotein translocase subunit SecA